MAKKATQAKLDNSRHVLVGSIFDAQTEKLAQSFAKSSRKFLDRLQSMQQQLDAQFELCSSKYRWNPREYFNCCSLEISARKTFEAWNAAKRTNSELGSFDGETLRKLGRLFSQMAAAQRTKSDVPVPTDLVTSWHQFRVEVDRLRLLLSLSNTTMETKPPVVPKQYSSFREPQEWLRLRKLKGLSNSRNTWPALCKKHGADIKRESTKSAQISIDLAQEWKLDLPEFRDSVPLNAQQRK